MKDAIRSRIKIILNLYIKWACKEEYKKQSFIRFNERAVEYAFVFKNLMKIYPKSILDVGTGITALPHLMRTCGFIVTATDKTNNSWTSRIINRHYHIVNDDITATQLTEKFDFISCISVLEHIKNADKAIFSMVCLLKENGYLLLTFPYNEKSYISNVYELEGASYGRNFSYIAQSFSRNEIDKWTKERKLEIVDQEYWKFWDGDHWTVGSQIIPPQKVNSQDKHQLSCILFKLRNER